MLPDLKRDIQPDNVTMVAIVRLIHVAKGFGARVYES